MNDLIDSNSSRGKVAHFETSYQMICIVWISKTPRDYRAKKNKLAPTMADFFQNSSRP